MKIKKSFYDWCIENNRQDILDRWDYELNKCSPKDIGYGSSKKYWFKCNKHKGHKSELYSINAFTSGYSNIKCKQCSSIAQYILNSFLNKELAQVWDYDKNAIDPWNIGKGSRTKIWIKCQEKDYHGSYEIRCYDFVNGHRCPYCSSQHGKVHPKDSLGQYIIDNYGEEFLWKVWSNKNEKSPFEYCINTHKNIWWNCFDNKHKSFKRSGEKSKECEYRCPECVSEREESIIEEKTRLYLEELGYEVKTEYRCNLVLSNPKTKQLMPFDNEVLLSNGKHLIIEVHGEQHYKINRKYIKTEEELKQRKLYDRYKRIKCIQAGYKYLEIPYTAFDKKETYKNLIDNKIREILDK